MKLHIMSDLHLDFNWMDVDNLEFDPESVLVLAGDLGEQDLAVPFVVAAAQRVRQVIYLMGNHEYYNGNINDTLEKIQEKITEPNVFVVSQGVLKLDDIVFICATLWTDFDKDNRHVKAGARYCMSDYRYIKNGRASLTSEDVLNRHIFDRQYIEEQLHLNKENKVVVVTHHAPSEMSVVKKYEGSSANPYFYSDLNCIMEERDIALWVHGHMHSTLDYTINNTRVVCNPRGYSSRKGKNENQDFNEHFILEV